MAITGRMGKGGWEKAIIRGKVTVAFLPYPCCPPHNLPQNPAHWWYSTNDVTSQLPACVNLTSTLQLRPPQGLSWLIAVSLLLCMTLGIL